MSDVIREGDTRLTDARTPLAHEHPEYAATVQVGSTSTGAPGTAASVSNSGDSTHVTLDFQIPRGDRGEAATVSVGATSTGAPGTSAAVTNSGDSTHAVFNFTVPKGDKGDPGPAVVHVGPTPPADLTMVWVDTSGV